MARAGHAGGRAGRTAKALRGWLEWVAVSSGERSAEVLERLWQFESAHPEWEPGDGWDPEVAWWAVATRDGLVLIDPLVEDWAALDRLVEQAGGCAAIIRTCHWHQRSVSVAAERYGAPVWARPLPAPSDSEPPALDQPIEAPQGLPGGLQAHNVLRDDEIAVFLPDHDALVFGDVVLRDRDGSLHMCPESWMRRNGGRARLREALTPLLDLAPRNLLVAHGPLVLGDGPRALAHALAETG